MNERHNSLTVPGGEDTEASLSVPIDFLDEPKFEGVSSDTASRVVAYIAVTYGKDTFCQTDVIKVLKINPGGMSKLTHALIDEGLIDDLGSIPDSTRANRPITVLQANEKLLDHVDRVPGWHEKAIFYRVMDMLKLSEEETTSYLIRLGAASLSIDYDTVRDNRTPHDF